MTQIIDGKKLAGEILAELKQEIATKQLSPKLAIILVGDNPASLTYIEKKRQAGLEIGIEVELHHFPSITTPDLTQKISQLNSDASINGIILQLPAPGVDQLIAMNAIAVEKDVDGLTAQNHGSLWQGFNNQLQPATAQAIIYTLEYIAIQQNTTNSNFFKGKHVVIVNHSNIIGKPLAGMLINRQATVTVSHEYTQDLQQLTSKADILVSGIGKPGIITKDHIQKAAIVIDCGFAKDAQDAVHGDIALAEIEDHASWLSPVPNGIGPLGVAFLMKNTVVASQL